jgi:hypothetical protein
MHDDMWSAHSIGKFRFAMARVVAATVPVAAIDSALPKAELGPSDVVTLSTANMAQVIGVPH